MHTNTDAIDVIDVIDVSHLANIIKIEVTAFSEELFDSLKHHEPEVWNSPLYGVEYRYDCTESLLDDLVELELLDEKTQNAINLLEMDFIWLVVPEELYDEDYDLHDVEDIDLENTINEDFFDSLRFSRAAATDYQNKRDIARVLDKHLKHWELFQVVPDEEPPNSINMAIGRFFCSETKEEIFVQTVNTLFDEQDISPNGVMHELVVDIIEVLQKKPNLLPVLILRHQAASIHNEEREEMMCLVLGVIVTGSGVSWAYLKDGLETKIPDLLKEHEKTTKVTPLAVEIRPNEDDFTEITEELKAFQFQMIEAAEPEETKKMMQNVEGMFKQ